MMDVSRQTMPMYMHPTHIDQDIADLKRLIQYLELQAYGAARRARAVAERGGNSTTATAEALLRKLRAAYNDTTRLRQTAMASGPMWAL